MKSTTIREIPVAERRRNAILAFVFTIAVTAFAFWTLYSNNEGDWYPYIAVSLAGCIGLVASRMFLMKSTAEVVTYVVDPAPQVPAPLPAIQFWQKPDRKLRWWARYALGGFLLCVCYWMMEYAPTNYIKFLGFTVPQWIGACYAIFALYVMYELGILLAGAAVCFGVYVWFQSYGIKHETEIFAVAGMVYATYILYSLVIEPLQRVLATVRAIEEKIQAMDGRLNHMAYKQNEIHERLHPREWIE